MKSMLAALFIFISGQCIAQTSGIMEANRKGLEILRKSLAAYGGAASTDSLRMAFKMTVKENISRGQSLTPYAPFEPYSYNSSFMVDRPKGIEIESRKSAIAGEFIFESTTFYQNGKGFSYDPVMKQYYDVTGNGITSTMTYLPQNTIAAALRNPVSVRYMNEQLEGNTPVHFIMYVAGGALDYLYIDKKTNYLVKQQRMYNSGTGEEVYEFRFKDHRNMGNIAMPASTAVAVHNPVHGTVTNTYTFADIRTDFTIDSAMLKVPEGYKKQDYSYRRKFEVRKLANDIYLLENITSSNFQWSYNILFAVMDDYVLVAEAPLNSAMTERVIAKIKETAPGKPIKYLVQSHHHDDHLGGIRGYIAEGATIITTANNVQLIEKIAKVPYNATPDRLQQNPRPAVIETVKNKKHVIKDNNHEAIIYDIGPNPHANEMIIVYFPKEKIIYECDLINKGEYPLTAPGYDFLKKIKAMNLKVETIASLHGQVVEKQEVEKLLNTGSW